MTSTFTRDDLAKYGEQTAAEKQEEVVEEVADEAADEATEARPDAEQAARPAAVERMPDEEPPLRFTDQLTDEPMPDLSDSDIAFNNDKYREKMAGWVKAQGRIEARRLLQEERVAKSTQKTRQTVEAKVEVFEKDHPDFKTVVRDNPVLAKNQLHPEAGALVARSKYTAELLYKFGKNPDLAVRTAQASPIQQGIIVDRLIAEIENEKVKSAPQRQPTLTRKDPLSMSAAELAQQSRQRKSKSRYYGK